MPKIIQLVAIISGIVFFVAIIGLILIYSFQPSHHPSEQQNTAAKPSPNKETKEGESFWQRIIRDPIAPFTLFLSIATLLLALAAFIQIGFLMRSENIAKNAADAAKKSAEIAEKTLIATQRPWVSVHMAIASGLQFSANEARITIRFNVKNVGNSPAIAIGIHPLIYLQTLKRDMMEEQKKVCGKLETTIDISKPFLRYMLFPNENFIQNFSLSISRADIDRSQAEFAETYKDMPPSNFISPVLVGCVSYRFAFDGSIHKTGFIADILRLDPQHPNARFAIDITGGDIPTERLILETFFSGSFAD